MTIGLPAIQEVVYEKDFKKRNYSISDARKSRKFSGIKYETYETRDPFFLSNSAKSELVAEHLMDKNELAASEKSKLERRKYHIFKIQIRNQDLLLQRYIRWY